MTPVHTRTLDNATYIVLKRHYWPPPSQCLNNLFMHMLLLPDIYIYIDPLNWTQPIIKL